MSVKKKRGRPVAHEDRERLQLVAFKADSEVMTALGELEAAQAIRNMGVVGGRRSQVIRSAILEARDRLHRSKLAENEIV